MDMNRFKNIGLILCGLVLGFTLSSPAARAVESLKVTLSTNRILVDGKESAAYLQFVKWSRGKYRPQPFPTYLKEAADSTRVPVEAFSDCCLSGSSHCHR